MLRYCIDNKVPFLGICLEMQMIGNYFCPNHQPGFDDTVKVNTWFNHYFKGDYCHFVNLRNGYLTKVFNINRIRVNSYHNFMVNYTDDVVVKGISDDGVIEALEVPNHAFGIGDAVASKKMIDYDENSRELLGEFISASNQKRLCK